MRYAWRFALLVAVFVVVGVVVDRLVLHHAAAGGAYALQVRMGAAMAGLFSGGAAAVLTGVAMVSRRGALNRRS